MPATPAAAEIVRGFAGVGPAAFARVALLVVQVGSAIALSRLLGPIDFGHFAMVSVLGACAILVASLGLQPALVQRPELEDRDVAAAFGLSLAIGAGLAAAFVLAAPLFTAFYGHPELTALARVQGAAIFAWALGDVPRALLSRRVEVGRMLGQELIAAAAAAAVSLSMAAAGGGAASIPSASLVGGAVSSLLALRAAGLRAWPVFDLPHARRLLATGLPLTGLNVLTYWSRNLDNLLIGKLAGDQPLGLYSRAFQVMLHPLWQLSGLVSAFLFPTLARLQHAPAEARATYLAGQGLMAAVTLPVLLGSMAAAGDLVPAVLGEPWMPMVPILEILLAAGIVQVPMMLVGPACSSHGRNSLLLRWGLLSAPLTMAALAAGASWRSAEAVALAYLAVQVALAVPTVRLVAATLGFRLRDVARVVAPAGGCALAMGALVAALGQFLVDWGRIPRLAACIAAGAACYLALAWRVGLPGLELLGRRPARGPHAEIG